MVVKRLTQKQHNFVKNYSRNGFNASQAALDSGYSTKYADSQSYKLPELPAIKEQLSNAYSKAEKALEINYQWILDKHMQIIRSCENSPLAQDKRVMIAALAELSKMQGYYSPEKKLNVSLDVTKAKLEEAKRIYDEY